MQIRLEAPSPLAVHLPTGDVEAHIEGGAIGANRRTLGDGGGSGLADQ